MLKRLLCLGLHNLILMKLGEEILGQRFLLGVQEFLIAGRLGVFWGHC